MKGDNLMEVLGIEVRLAKDPTMTGTLIREYTAQKIVRNDKGEEELREIPVCVVLWDKRRVPALHYHNPMELEWVAFMPALIENVDGPGDDEDEDEDEEEYEEDEETEAHA